MQYPSRSEYCSSIRNPQFAFRKKDYLTKVERNLDSNLVNGKAVERNKPDGTKDIWSASGSFAIVFKFETFFPTKIWAIRCFYRSNFEIKDHYKAALVRIKNSSCRSYFVDFSFLEEGIRVQGNCYPILKMEWVEGENLKKFIKANLNNKERLKLLAELWMKLSKQLLDSGIAHGDLQHGNVLIVNHYNQLSIKLIDYDSLYFSEGADSIDDNIKGLTDYQHPLRKTLKKRCFEIDFFSQLVIYISILALAENNKLWEAYRIDEKEGMLFSSSDFQDPDRASIFKALAKLPHPLPELANKFKEICQLKDFRDIPSLDSVLFNKKECISERADSSLSWQASSHSQFINPTLSYTNFIHSFRQTISEQMEKWEAISVVNCERYFEAKAKAKIQNLESKLVSRSFITSLNHKTLVENLNTLKSSTSKALVSLAPAKMLLKEKANNFLTWFANARRGLFQIYSSIHNELSRWLNALKRESIVLVFDLVDKLKNIFQFLSGFSRIFSFSERVETVLSIEAQLTDSYSLSSTQQQLCQSSSLTESEDKKEKREIESKTWATSETASQLGCSISWCNNQRYQYPDQFHQGTHYHKDKAGMIRWTEAGIEQLRCLQMRKKVLTIPSTSLTTKEVSARLGIPAQMLSKIKAKHTFKFIEGTHYYIDARRRYYWTPLGIELLRQLQDAYSSKSLHSKTQSS